jgi:uncharacterized protein
MNRAYSILEVRSFDEDQRILEGLATSPKTDRMGDVVVPSGGRFSLPLPLLWAHDATKPIGEVLHASVSDDGIRIRARVESDDQPGPLRDLLDMAWRSIRKKLVKGLSIGFRPLSPPSPLKGGGLRFDSWELLEISAVVIPANSAASITVVRSIDLELRRAIAFAAGARDLRMPAREAS